MRDNYSFRLKLDPDPDDIEELRSRLEEYNNSRTGKDEYKFLLLTVDDEAGKLTAGLYARIHYSWMFIDSLWVAEKARGRGLGTKLLEQAEEQARRHGCHSVWLDTFSFQAPDFYRKQGYENFGELPSYPAEHRRYFLSKKLS
jgi:ribosomal protein S18 acetylase RimI-like enzyme